MGKHWFEGKKNFYILGVLFVLALLLLVFFMIYPWGIESFSQEPDILLVVSRYNEDLEWMKEEPFRKKKTIIYNKGPNENFYKPENLQKVVPLKNVGRCDHTYLHHIVENYDNDLNEIIVFLPGSCDLPNKIDMGKNMMREIETQNKSVMIGHTFSNVKENLYDFQLDHWEATSPINKEMTKDDALTPANIRPFGAWYEDKFPGIETTHISFGGVFSVSKQDVLQHPKSHYESLLSELEVSPNPEVGHYFERSWEAVFYPMDNTVFLAN